MAQLVGLAVAQKLTLTQLRQTPLYHPTFEETLRVALEARE